MHHFLYHTHGYAITILYPWVCYYYFVPMGMLLLFCTHGYAITILYPWVCYYYFVPMGMLLLFCTHGYAITILYPWVCYYYFVPIGMLLLFCTHGYAITILYPWVCYYYFVPMGMLSLFCFVVCGGDLRDSSHGSINSPGYPGNYPINRDCSWTVQISPGNVIHFTFSQLAMEHHNNCSYDYLEVSIKVCSHVTSPSPCQW